MKLAIIPARGGSKRIPRKNIKSFHGRPMIAYSIDAALKSKAFDNIIVSTEDEDIARVASEHGAQVPFFRPSKLADDHTPTVPVIAHAIKACRDLGWDVQDVCCLYPSTPFIAAADLLMAYDALTTTGANYTFPVTAFPSPIQRALRRLSDGSVKPFHPQHTSTRTQDLEAAYFDAGQFYWGKASTWLNGTSLHANSFSLVIPDWRVVDIDTPDDWERAELLYATFLERFLV